jgi:peptidoglycan/LPS O-acetylase OafA/YrhL
MTAPMWFIPFVLQVYLILPLLAKRPVRLWAIPAAFLISGGACALVYVLQPATPEHAYAICRNWSPIFRLPEVIVGWLLGRARTLTEVTVPVSLYILCCAAVAVLAGYCPQASPTILLPLKGAVAFVVLGTLGAAILPLVKNHAAGAVALLGRASFPFFLLHGPGIVFMGSKFGANVLPWVLYFVLCWIGAVLFTVALERMLKGSPIGKSAPGAPTAGVST